MGTNSNNSPASIIHFGGGVQATGADSARHRLS